MDKKIVYVLEIFLIVIIPLLTVGFDFFENTKLYKSIFHFDRIEKAIGRWSTNYGPPVRGFINREYEREEFNDLWYLIRTNTYIELPDRKPYWISRIAIENAPYVRLPPNDTEVPIVPDSVPVFVGYCPEYELVQGICKKEDAVMVGTIEDIKRWYHEKQRKIRVSINLFITLISILMGLITLSANKIRSKTSEMSPKKKSTMKKVKKRTTKRKKK